MSVIPRKFVFSMKKLFVFLLFVFFAESRSMSMYAFDVGPGSFILFKHENRAFVVDCGTYRSDISSYATHTEFRENVKSVLDGVDHVKIAVTHPHVDHYNLIKALFFAVNPVCSTEKINGVLVCASLPIVALQGLNVNGSSVIYVTNISHKDNVKKIKSFLVDALFEIPDKYNHIEPLLVGDFFEKIRDDSDPHDMNLMLKIVCGNEESKQAVLLPGDASVNLISAVREQHPDLYENVECILWPHHSSCDSG